MKSLSPRYRRLFFVYSLAFLCSLGAFFMGSFVAKNAVVSAQTGEAIEGRVTVYSCVEPTAVQITVCDPVRNSCASLPFSHTKLDNTVWLDDSSGDRTYIYSYRITVDPYGRPLQPGAQVTVHSAFAFIGGRTIPYSSSPDQNTTVQVNGTHDLTIHAGGATCSCFIYARSYIKDVDTGELITELDESVPPFTVGSANDQQIIAQGNDPRTPFTGGQLIVGPAEFDNSPFGYNSYGKDGLANVRAYVPAGYSIVGHECRSEGSLAACPGETFEYKRSFPASSNSSGAGANTGAGGTSNGANIYGLRVACGTTLDYGWLVRKTASSQPTPPANQTDPNFRNISCMLRNDSSPTDSVNNDCRPRNFRISEIKSNTANLAWDTPSGNCGTFTEGRDRYVIVVRDGNDIVAIRQEMKDESTGVGNNDRNDSNLPFKIARRIDEWESGKEYTAYLYAYKDNNLSCVSQPAQLTFKRGDGASGGSGGSGGGPGGGGSGGGGASNDPLDYNSFNMILMDADNIDAQCYSATNFNGKDIEKGRDQIFNHSKGQYSCGTNRGRESMGVVFNNKSMKGIPDPNIADGNQIRVKWQTHRCEDGSKVPCQEEGERVDRMTEAADWWCVPPGKRIYCEWDTYKWKSSPPAVRCYVSSEGESLRSNEVTNVRTCQYTAFAAANGANIPMKDIDINGDGFINLGDLLIAIDKLGTQGGGPEDLIRDEFNTVNAADLSVVIANIGNEVPTN